MRLTALLEAAKNQLADAEIKLSDLVASANTLPGIIAKLEADSARLKIEYDACLARVAEIQAKIDQLKTVEVVNIITQI